jgi:heme exporter protein A
MARAAIPDARSVLPPERPRGVDEGWRQVTGGPPVCATGLERSFAGLPVLRGVDLTVEAGESVALLGSNGAGKTTLLRVLALLLRPERGRLALFGSDGPATPALRRRIGFVGHESFCYPDLTAVENLAFYARLFGVADASTRIAELLAWAGLEAAARRQVRTYSRGMGQRLALARALLHRPDLLLLDEPFSGLDPQAIDALQERLAALRLAGHAIVLTTHDVERAAPVASRLAILHRGRIAWAHDGGAPDVTVIAAAYRRVVVG